MHPVSEKLDLHIQALNASSSPAFSPGNSPIPASGKVIGEKETINIVESAIDGWLTDGRWVREFELGLGSILRSTVLTCNSGSSANLLAFSALMSPLLGVRALKPKDEVICVAAAFPTTVGPIIQNGCVPVFVDVSLPTYNIDVSQLEDALSDKTGAIMIAHTLGNPFNIEAVNAFAKKNCLWLIEDSCDSLGSTYMGKPVGTFGDIGTLSFYPAHHITTGEGGAVFSNNPLLINILRSIRDWGRACYCKTGLDNTCANRFRQQHGSLPFGFDHKYTYSHLGYNLKMTDLQASVGVAQLSKLPSFTIKRQRNFEYLHGALEDMQDMIILPEATEHSVPSWFGFPITLRSSCAVDRFNLIQYLDDRKIGTRMLFSGNITRQPCMHKKKYRTVGSLPVSDIITKDTFWVGVWPGLTFEMLDYVASCIGEFVAGKF